MYLTDVDFFPDRKEVVSFILRPQYNCVDFHHNGSGRGASSVWVHADPGQGGAGQPDVEAGRHQHQLHHCQVLPGDEPVERPGRSLLIL